MVDLRAKFGIMVEKSGVEPSFRVGEKFKSLQTCTEMDSKVWPEVITTGSAMRELEIGQRNSKGGSFDWCLEDEELELRWNEIFHLGLPFPPISKFSMNFQAELDGKD